MTATRPFTSNEIEAFAKIIGDTLIGSDIRTRLNERGIPTNLSAISTKRWYLKETLVAWQDLTDDSEEVLRFIEHVMQPVNFIGKSNIRLSLLEELNEALAYCGLTMNEDGTIKQGAQTASQVEKAIDSSIAAQSDKTTVSQVPPFLREGLMRFHIDYPSTVKTGFIIMRFGKEKPLLDITQAIKSTLAHHGLNAVRADDKRYNDHMLTNVETYMQGCSFGIAVFERFKSNDHNANVALEVGYMLALGKSVCLLKDNTITSLQADLLGLIFDEFDPLNIMSSVKDTLAKWLRDKGLIDSLL